MKKDQRIVYGICTWWDSIDKAANKDGLPCCPHCGSPLFEMSSIEEWNSKVNEHEKKDPGYAKFVEWLRGKCFKNYGTAREAYRQYLAKRDAEEEDGVFLKKIFLDCAISNEMQRIVSIRGKKSGLDHVEIITKGETTSWKHRIYTEEI